jgi:hypothetical protein
VVVPLKHSDLPLLLYLLSQPLLFIYKQEELVEVTWLEVEPVDLEFYQIKQYLRLL